MIYEDNSSIPKRSVPLNGLADKSIPGGNTVPIVIAEQWGGIPKRGNVLGAIPIYGIPQNYVYTPSPTLPSQDYGGGGYYGPDPRDAEYERKLRLQILEDDQEIMEFLAVIMPTLN